MDRKYCQGMQWAKVHRTMRRRSCLCKGVVQTVLMPAANNPTAKAGGKQMEIVCYECSKKPGHIHDLT